MAHHCRRRPAKSTPRARRSALSSHGHFDHRPPEKSLHADGAYERSLFSGRRRKKTAPFRGSWAAASISRLITASKKTRARFMRLRRPRPAATIRSGYKKNCDEYFFNKHRQRLNPAASAAFSSMTSATASLSSNAQRENTNASTLPSSRRRYKTPYGEYSANARFNCFAAAATSSSTSCTTAARSLACRSNGRVESILCSLPPLVSWRYDYVPVPGSPEAELTEKFLVPRERGHEAFSSCCFLAACGQPPTPIPWARSIGGDGLDIVTSVATGDDDTVLVAGTSTGSFADGTHVWLVYACAPTDRCAGSSAWPTKRVRPIPMSRPDRAAVIMSPRRPFPMARARATFGCCRSTPTVQSRGKRHSVQTVKTRRKRSASTAPAICGCSARRNRSAPEITTGCSSKSTARPAR